MNQINAIGTTSITGMMVTDDGAHMLLKVAKPDGQEIIVAFPKNQLANLIDMSALATEKSAEIQKEDLSIRDIHSTTWWELSRSVDSGLIVLSLTFGSGGRLHFSLPGTMPEALFETLGTMLGLIQPPPTQGAAS